jgi:DNA-3-methyladenine glycosylase I
MSSDVIIGHDGKPRCVWAGAGDTAFGRYHDEVWGTRTDDESALFEALTLGVFEVGLSWSIVFGKRDAFRKAFRGFDVAKVAAMTARDVDRLVQDASIIRNRDKIQATVDNARAMTSASPSLVALAKSYEITRKRAPRSVADLPKVDPTGGGVREAAEVAGVLLRGAYERVRVHAERRRGQRPRPWVLPRDRLPRHGPEPLSAPSGIRTRATALKGP